MCLSFGHFISFFFCYHVFIVYRYKKPHAARAMEKIKPLNQKQITKERYGTSKYPLSRGFFLRRALSHIERKVETHHESS